MVAEESAFHETSKPIRDLGLTIAGTWLEPILTEFEEELKRAGVQKVRPRFYLSTEWGVPSDSIAIAIPFYLARPELTAIHAKQAGYVEGVSRADVLRYLRHEMGHVVNYAYRLYEDKEWVKLFGSMAQPYVEEYRPQPFSPRYVEHLPGWYAQKHPDEDWAETFAVWMTPRLDWRAQYADAPVALAKLTYCDETVGRVRDQEPVVNAVDLDEDVTTLGYSLESYYRGLSAAGTDKLPVLDGDLRAIFEEPEAGSSMKDQSRHPAGALIRRCESALLGDVYRWTGHFPERTRVLLRYLAERAEQLRLSYAEEHEMQAMIAVATMVTALAMNHVSHGSYVPDLERPMGHGGTA